MCGCANATFKSMTPEESARFHQNYDGANGNFSFKERYDWLHGVK